MIVRLRLFGAEVLSLTIGDDDPQQQEGEVWRDVATGAADLSIAEPQPMGCALPRTEHEPYEDRRRA